jgi:hypothetical protein
MSTWHHGVQSKGFFHETLASGVVLLFNRPRPVAVTVGMVASLLGRFPTGMASGVVAPYQKLPR